MVAVKRAYVDGPHGQMHVRIARAEGAGEKDGRPPLICIHMSPMTGRVFENFLARMGQDRTAIAFDTPGFGLSDAPAAPPAIADYAASLLSGLTALGIDGPVDVMGYHTGAMTAIEMAASAPARVRRLITVAAPIITEEERHQFRAFYKEKPAQADGSHILDRWTGFHYHHMRPGADLEEISEKFSDALTGGRKAAWGHQAAFNYDLAGRMPQVAQPLLVLVNGDDLDVQTRRAQGLARNALLLETPGWGHGFLDMYVDDAAALARRFLDTAAADPRAGLTAPVSALGPRYPQKVGAFRPREEDADTIRRSV